MGIKSSFAKGYLAGKRGDEGVASLAASSDTQKRNKDRERAVREENARIETRRERHQKAELTSQQYQSGLISRQEGRSRLRGLGFSSNESEDMLMPSKSKTNNGDSNFSTYYKNGNKKKVSEGNNIRIRRLSSMRQTSVSTSRISNKKR